MSCDYWSELIIIIRKSLEASQHSIDAQDEVICAAELHLSWYKRAGPKQVNYTNLITIFNYFSLIL